MIALRVLNLGAGVQSSTLALLASRREHGLEPPDCAIFADTGWESSETYRFLDWLNGELDFPVYEVSLTHKPELPGIRNDVLRAVAGARFASIPFFTESRRGKRGQLRRQCTKEYKIEPIKAKCKELLGLKPRQRVPKGVVVEQWFGISKDELYRVKPSQVPWIVRRWPLVFDLQWTRQDCIRWWESVGLEKPPRSACIGCPYHSDAEWREMKRDRPAEFLDAVEFDKIIRGGMRGTKEKLYLHSSLKPLSEVDFRSAEDMGQQSLFTAECEGMCGV